jgi:transcriptional regulator with XRE-family HTH domain
MDEKVLLGKRIKELRAARGLSQEQLAEKMGISPKYLSSIERSRENPTLEMLVKLAHGLGVQPVMLFAWLNVTDAEKRRQIRTMADRASADQLLQIFAWMKANGL